MGRKRIMQLHSSIVKARAEGSMKKNNQSTNQKALMNIGTF
jgi:hypothetical protein